MKVIMYPAISLDGFIADLHGDSDWVNAEDEARYEQKILRSGCVIVGGVTYRQYIDDFKNRKQATTFVCTQQEGTSDTENIKFVSGSPIDILKQVAADGFSEAVICGGGEVNGLFVTAGCVDEIIISIYPRVLGSGIPLFGSHKPVFDLELLSNNQDVPGIIQNHYKLKAGKIELTERAQYGRRAAS